MPRVIRLYWRLDYTPSYSYLDKRGSALRALSDTVKDFWSSVGIGSNVPLSFVAQHLSSTGQRYLSLEPASMNGSIEWAGGIEIDDVLASEVFRQTNKIVQELLKICDVRVMARAGVRLVCLAKFADGRRDSFKRVSKILNLEFYQQTESVLGAVNDLAIILEGTTRDNLGYRATFGPYASKNVDLALQLKLEPQQYEQLNENDLFFDIDLFENNISFIEHSLFRWSNTKVAKIAEFIALYEKAAIAAVRA
jgi:hypothetical protein